MYTLTLNEPDYERLERAVANLHALSYSLHFLAENLRERQLPLSELAALTRSLYWEALNVRDALQCAQEGGEAQ